MIIATVSFDRTDEAVNWDQADIQGLQDTVLTALHRHFPTFGNAAGAQTEHRKARSKVEGDSTLHLFSMNEAFRAAVHASRPALAWESFVRDATAGIAPFCFSIRFNVTD
jgi:hypothetical protein